MIDRIEKAIVALDETLIGFWQALINRGSKSNLFWAQLVCGLGGASSAEVVVWAIAHAHSPIGKLGLFTILTASYLVGMVFLQMRSRQSYHPQTANYIREVIIIRIVRVLSTCVLLWDAGTFIYDFVIFFTWPDLMFFISMRVATPVALCLAACDLPPPKFQHARARSRSSGKQASL